MRPAAVSKEDLGPMPGDTVGILACWLSFLQTYVDPAADRAKAAPDETTRMRTGFRALILNQSSSRISASENAQFLGASNESQVLDIRGRCKHGSPLSARGLLQQGFLS
jgi:hypothetical protein